MCSQKKRNFRVLELVPCCKLSYFSERWRGTQADYFSKGSTVKMENVEFCIILCFCLALPRSEPRNRMFQLWQPKHFCWCNLCASTFCKFPHYFNCENIFRCSEELTVSLICQWLEVQPSEVAAIVKMTRNDFALCRLLRNLREASR